MKNIIVTLAGLLSFNVVSSELNACGNNEQAQTLYKLISADSEQKRKSIRCNKTLMIAAEAKAKKMADYGLVLHNLGGSPNSHLENSGYKLPKHYGRDFTSNQVEAIAGGYSTAAKVWNAFKRSRDHRTHLLGEHEFYIEQDEIGIAFIKERGSSHIEYWVVYLSQGYEKDQNYSSNVNNIPNKSSYLLSAPKNKD
ncbi:CAP domain-containing protein [Thalassotalea sp. PLHSN55]|uniref:CAP domain-containing protein n=1 Tax=Thalassotalea sp. PLHSN55 TaxID=3435888 RepID=UPI003F85FFF6